MRRSAATDCGRPRTNFGSRRGWWRLAVLAAVHLAILGHVLHWHSAGETLSPLEPSEAGETLLSGAINAGFLLFVLLLLSTLLLGRFFCGWACHIVALQDGCAWLMARLGIRPRPVRSRLLAFVPVFAAFEMFALPSILRAVDGHAWPELSWQLTTDDLWMRFPGLGIAALTLAVDGFLLVWVLGAKGFCTYGCPYGALFGIVDRAAPGRIRVSSACDGCAHCTAVCTSNVAVHSEVARFGQVVDSGCMKCLDCVSSCPKGALSFGFGESRAAAVARAGEGGGRPPRAFDFSWAEEATLALTFALGLYAFRNLYGAVPFLLAIGLAVLSAVALVWLARLLRAGSLRWQGRELTRARWPGAWAGVACAAWLGFAGHSALVQWHTRAGEGSFAQAGATSRTQGGARAELFDSAAASLERAQRLGWFARADLYAKRGFALRELGRHAEAESELRRALELDPGLSAPRIALADLLLLRAARDEARAEIEEVLRRDPHNAAAQARMTALGERR